ncbi:TPA: hypothetical protein RGO87_001039 [Proteus mirabilis]|nr:hypothetical protein [Proteus mirabilis]
MLNLRNDFDSKTNEILEYISLIEFIENSGNSISSLKEGSVFSLTSSIRKTLKGTVFILLYNLVESTMREAICYIHEDINNKRIDFSELKKSLQQEIIKRIKNDNTDINNLLSKINLDINKNISYATFNKKKLFSGNIDREEITSKSKVYGFSCSSNYNTTKHGEKLRTVKQHRNDLAHGNVSFSEIGMTQTISDIKNISDEVIAYLDEITNNIQDYVTHQKYKDKP